MTSSPASWACRFERPPRCWRCCPSSWSTTRNCSGHAGRRWQRGSSAAEWIAGLPDIQVRRAVRLAHLLGDSDELLIGARLISGHELTCVVRLDHNIISGLDDAFVVADSIDNVRATAIDTNIDPDVSFVEMTLADARAWIQDGLARTAFPMLSESWADCRLYWCGG